MMEMPPNILGRDILGQLKYGGPLQSSIYSTARRAGNPRRGWPLSGQCPNENRLDKKASRSLELVLRRVIRERSRSRSVTYSSTKGPNRAKIVREFMRAMFKKHNGLTAIELIGEPPAGFPGQDQFRDEVGRSFDLEIELALRRRHQASDEGETPVPGSGNGVAQASGTLRPGPTREQDDPGDEGEDREGGAEDENGRPDEEQKTADQQSSDGVTLESSESVMKKSCPEDSTPVWTDSTISIDLSHPSTSSLPLKVDKRQDSMMGIREPEEEEGDTQCYYPAKEVSSDEWSTYLGDNDSMECQELEVDCELVLDQDVTTSDVVTPAENESASRQETTPQSRIYREEDRKWLRYQVEIMSREECIIYCLIGHLLLTLEEMPGTRALVPTADEARQALLKLTVGSHWDVMNLSELMQYSEKVEKAIEIIGTYHSLDYSSESRYRLNRMLMSFVEFRIPDFYESWD